jgi:hypothetical protein
MAVGGQFVGGFIEGFVKVLESGSQEATQTGGEAS